MCKILNIEKSQILNLNFTKQKLNYTKYPKMKTNLFLRSSVLSTQLNLLLVALPNSVHRRTSAIL